jgi:hypothetical protein
MITAAQIVEAVRAALPHANLFDAASLVSDALSDVPFEWFVRAIELPLVGPFAVALLSVVCVVGVFIVWTLAFLIVIASVVVTHSVITAAPVLAVIVNFVRLAHASVGL